ncbi:hypothetical protein [Streptomyces sp. NPDC055607]
MQNPNGHQNTEPVPRTARVLVRRTTTGLLGLTLRAANDIAVRLAVWAEDPRNHEEALSLRSTSSALPEREPSGG